MKCPSSIVVVVIVVIIIVVIVIVVVVVVIVVVDVVELSDSTSLRTEGKCFFEMLEAESWKNILMKKKMCQFC